MFNSRNKTCISGNFKSQKLNFSEVIKQDIDVLKVLKLKLIAGTIRYVYQRFNCQEWQVCI